MHPLAIIFRVMHISHKMRRETGRDPTPQDVAEKCSIPLERSARFSRSPKSRSCLKTHTPSCV
jgi:F0F1-type ATP synthase alpha subunit